MLTTYFQFGGWRYTLFMLTNQNHCYMRKLNDMRMKYYWVWNKYIQPTFPKSWKQQYWPCMHKKRDNEKTKVNRCRGLQGGTEARWRRVERENNRFLWCEGPVPSEACGSWVSSVEGSVGLSSSVSTTGMVSSVKQF